MKNKILQNIGLSVIILALILSIIFPSVAIGTTPLSSDDEYEDNDDFYSAISLTPGYYSELNASDEDWYYFRAYFGDLINIGIYFSHSEGNLDIELYEPGFFLFKASDGMNNEEHIVLTAQYSGDYYIRVHGETNGQIYDLNIWTNTTEEDYMEDNDNFSSAWEIFEEIRYNLTLFDDDWFKIWIDKGLKLNFDLGFDRMYGELDFSFYDDSEMLLLSSHRIGDDDWKNWVANYTGYHYIRVNGTNSYYDIWFKIYDPNYYQKLKSWTIATIFTGSSVAVSSLYFSIKIMKKKKKNMTENDISKSASVLSLLANNMNLLNEIDGKGGYEVFNMIEQFKVTSLSDEFCEKIEKLEWKDNEKIDFINDMLSLTSEERNELLDGMISRFGTKRQAQDISEN